MTDLNELLKAASKAAKLGGEILKHYYAPTQRQDLGMETKTNWRDIVTIADKEAEAKIVDFIKANFPDHSILGEEGTSIEGSGEYKWVIDPLDGTTNFFHTYPFFCTSIGIVDREGQGVVGAIYDPIKDELFTAIRGQGSFLNGRRMSVSKTAELKQALLVTGFAYRDDARQRESLELFSKLNFTCHGVRRDGSAALDLAYVACGRLDAFWEFGLKPWDTAAGALMVQEAGGLVSNLNDFGVFELHSGDVLASNAGLTGPIRGEMEEIRGFVDPIALASLTLGA